jgi:hypothetical protein
LINAFGNEIIRNTSLEISVSEKRVKSGLYKNCSILFNPNLDWTSEYEEIALKREILPSMIQPIPDEKWEKLKKDGVVLKNTTNRPT